MTGARLALSPEDRAAAVEILTAWNGDRACMAWAVDRFPKSAAAMLETARRVLTSRAALAEAEGV